MRLGIALMGAAILAGVGGCASDGRFNLLRSNDNKKPLPAEVPAKEDLVAYLNNNSAKVPGILSDDITLTCHGGGTMPIPIGGMLRAQSPRNFRMTAQVMSKPEVDIGSNNQEFWYWIPRGDKHQFFCSYDALEQNKVKFMPFPFQPEWVMEAMGMGRYGPPEKYELAVEPEQLKLIERTRSPQGARVKKIIVFRRRESKNADQPQVTDFLLVDEATNKTLCSAHITRRHKIEHREAGTIVEIPREMELRWPAQQLKLVLQLNKVQLANQFPETVFRRTPIQGYPAFDLATGPAEPVHRAGGPGGLEPDR